MRVDDMFPVAFVVCQTDPLGGIRRGRHDRPSVTGELDGSQWPALTPDVQDWVVVSWLFSDMLMLIFNPYLGPYLTIIIEPAIDSVIHQVLPTHRPSCIATSTATRHGGTHRGNRLLRAPAIHTQTQYLFVREPTNRSTDRSVQATLELYPPFFHRASPHTWRGGKSMQIKSGQPAVDMQKWYPPILDGTV